MQHVQRSNEIKDQLSNIIEERSEVHNISSIKSSQLVQNLKVNQQLCFMCEEPNIEIEPGKPTRHQNILVYPCLCNRMAHRECMKKYLIQTQTFICEVCKANYAVGRSPSKILTQITPSVITSWLGRAFLCFVFTIIMILIILYISSFDNDTNLVQTWKVALIVLFGIVLGLIGLYVIFVIRSTLRRLRRSDIEVYCNQTEIGLHTKNTKEILKDYYENAVHYSSLEDYQLNEGNEDKEEITKRGAHQPTNASMLHTKEEEKKKKYRYELEVQNMDKILNIYDEEAEIAFKRRDSKKGNHIEIPIAYLEKEIEFKPENKKSNAIRIEEGISAKKSKHDLGEMSSIRIEKKDLTNNESFHSVNIIIEENARTSQAAKQNGPISSVQLNQDGKVIITSYQTEEEKYNASLAKEFKKAEQKPIFSDIDLHKTINQYDDIDIDFNIPPDQINNHPKTEKEASLSLSLTHHPVTY